MGSPPLAIAEEGGERRSILLHLRVSYQYVYVGHETQARATGRAPAPERRRPSGERAALPRRAMPRRSRRSGRAALWPAARSAAWPPRNQSTPARPMARRNDRRGQGPRSLGVTKTPELAPPDHLGLNATTSWIYRGAAPRDWLAVSWRRIEIPPSGSRKQRFDEASFALLAPRSRQTRA